MSVGRAYHVNNGAPASETVPIENINMSRLQPNLPMKKISSSFGKRFTLGVVMLALMGIGAGIILPAVQSGQLSVELFLPPLFFAVTFAFFFFKFFADLVDEVWDDGNALVVRHRDRELRIPLSDIVNVNCSTTTNPPRATLTLRNPTQMGKEIAFIPKRTFTFNPFARNRMIDDLIERIDAARRR